MAKVAKQSLQASDAFAITPSNTLDIASDPGNATNFYTFCYVHCAGTAGLVKIDTVDGGTVSMYCNQGEITIQSSIAIYTGGIGRAFLVSISISCLIS